MTTLSNYQLPNEKWEVRRVAAAGGSGLSRVDHIGEVDRVPDEEHRGVATDEVPVAVLCVELDRKAARVTCGRHSVPPIDHVEKPQHHVDALGRLLEQLPAGVLGDRLVIPPAVGLKEAYAVPPRVCNTALRSAFD
jgi:hypothetical protein